MVREALSTKNTDGGNLEGGGGGGMETRCTADACTKGKGSQPHMDWPSSGGRSYLGSPGGFQRRWRHVLVPGYKMKVSSQLPTLDVELFDA